MTSCFVPFSARVREINPCNGYEWHLGLSGLLLSLTFSGFRCLGTALKCIHQKESDN